jgi:hypothetical protein
MAQFGSPQRLAHDQPRKFIPLRHVVYPMAPAKAIAACGLAAAALAAAAGTAAAAVRVPWGASRTFTLNAATVTDPLSTPEGPGRVALKPASASASTGEGIIALTMDAPGTSWRSAADPAAVAEVSVDGGPPQTIELFYGAQPFTYEGFLGPLSAGRHKLTVSSSSTLSGAHDAPPIMIGGAQLGIVPQSDPAYWADAYAPFIYGRSSSASAYIPLLTYINQSTGSDGSHSLSYSYVISAHDQGDSVVPAYQWGTWGRMTDIVSVINETVAPDGTVTSAVYSSCACEGTPYPDSLQSPTDTAWASFTGSWLGRHPMLRDATATNYLSQDGTTPYRFQQGPVAGPLGGQVRESVMDSNPWTYEVSNEELPREHLISHSPDNLLVGDYRQYAIIDSDVEPSGSDSVQFELQLGGSSTWYSTDYEQMSAEQPSTFAFHDGGHNRSVIKLPLDWSSRPITGFRIRLTVGPGNPPARAAVRSLQVLEVTQGWRVIARSIPPVTVYQAPALDPGTLPF